MKNFLYCMFIMTLLSIDSNAQPGNSISELRKSDLWTDLGEILEPVIVRETYDTRNGTIMGMRIMIFISLFLYIAQPSLFPISMDRA